MKTFVVIFLNLLFICEVCPQSDASPCDDNSGNFWLWESFLYNNQLYLVKEFDLIYILNDFKWDGTQFSFTDIKTIDIKDWKFEGFLLYMFTIGYPGFGQRVMAILIGENDSPGQWSSYIMDLEQNGTIVDRKEITIDVNYCSSYPEELRLCSLFSKFPNTELDSRLQSITPYPIPVGPLPRRVLVHYKELPPNSVAYTCPLCYRTKRFVFKGQDLDIGNNVTQFEWTVDNSTSAQFVDLNGREVNASTPLTDYTSNGNGFQFDWIEFFGTEFSVFRITVTEGEASEQFQVLKTGRIGELLRCPPGSGLTSSAYDDLPFPDYDKPNLDESHPTDYTQNNDSYYDDEEERPRHEDYPEQPEPPLPGEGLKTKAPDRKAPYSSTVIYLIVAVLVLFVVLLIALIVCCRLRSKTEPKSDAEAPPAVPPPAAPPASPPRMAPETQPQSSGTDEEKTPPKVELTEPKDEPQEDEQSVRSDLNSRNGSDSDSAALAHNQNSASNSSLSVPSQDSTVSAQDSTVETVSPSTLSVGSTGPDSSTADVNSGSNPSQ